MHTKTCSVCNIEKHINNFYKRLSECKDCNRARGLERFYDIKYKISNQQKLFHEKNREKLLLQNQNSRCIGIRD